MNCPHCGKDMEQGRIFVTPGGSLPVALIVWYAEKEFEKRDLLEVVRRVPVGIADTPDGHYKDAYYCRPCQRVFGEFPTIE
ncbi:MAG: PF20097 family protein [Oscillospiraceae bacterium]|nr:PF20097 family protein [Oscillospiraceae bacterium]